MLTRRRLNVALIALSGAAALPVSPAAQAASARSLRLAVTCSYAVEGARRVRTSKPFLVRLDSYGTSFDVPDSVLLPTFVSQATGSDGRSTPYRRVFGDFRVGVIDGVASLRSTPAGQPELVLRVRQIDLTAVVPFDTPGGPISLPSWDDRRFEFVVAAPRLGAPVNVPTGTPGLGMTVSLA